MPRKVYACKDKGNADKAFRTGSPIGDRSNLPTSISTKGSRGAQETKIVYLSTTVPAYSSGTPLTQVTGQQVVHLNVTTGIYSTTSVFTGAALGTIDFYNATESSYASGEYVVLYKWQGSWWVQGSQSSTVSGGTGYGALTSALASTDATASVTFDAASPLEPSTTVSATNWVGMDGASGAKCIVAKQGTEYILIQLACPAP